MNRKHLVQITIFTFAIFQVVYYFYPSEFIFYLSIIVLLYVLSQAMINMPKINKSVCIGLFILGSALMIYADAAPAVWIKGLGKNGLLIALFVCAPMLNIPFTYEDYQSELKNIAKVYLHTMIPFYLLISIPTHIFAALTGFAAFVIMYNLFQETSKLYNSEDIFIATLGRSYASSGFWGSSWVSVLLVVSELGIPWYRIIPIGMIFTVVSISINLISIKIKMFKEPKRYPRLQPDKEAVVDWSKIFTALSLAILIVFITLTINIYTGWKLLSIIPLVACAFPLAVALVQKKMPEYTNGLKSYYENSLYKSQTEVTLFTAAGFLATALEISGVSALIPKIIPDFLINYPPLLIGSLMLLVIIPGQMGIHPVATGTAMVVAIVPASIGLAVPTFAWTIICAWLLSNMLSPFSALNLTLSGLAGRPSWEVGLGLSWRYGLVCLIVYSLMVSVIGPML
ncbi:MAG: hypothetical protein JM58_15460 [Peptococcaceae bacterium BICA1-8]|nr:MAG: hypothetical protein JM58_15460 [Peptococcaceae bacterium BICA1-8]